MDKSSAELLEAIYLTEAYIFGKVVPIEYLEKGISINMVKLIDKVHDIRENRYRIELMMFPSWAWPKKKLKVYEINGFQYTHIKIKEKLLKGVDYAAE